MIVALDQHSTMMLSFYNHFRKLAIYNLAIDRGNIHYNFSIKFSNATTPVLSQ